MRKLIAVLALTILPIPALAMDYQSCWVAEVLDPFTGESDQVTRCRIAGGGVVDYATDDEVPAVLYPNLGTDLVGPCWFLTSAVTNYVIITRFSDGRATIGLDTDPANPINPILIAGTFVRCTSEPTPLVDPASEAWDYVMSYIHAPPTPELNPKPGDGITGMDTYIGIEVPEDHAATLSGGGSTIDVEIEVDTVVVSWGDGRSDTYPASESILAGYPDGSAIHIYEVKDETGVNVTVEYDWTARWRAGGGAWLALPVPNTTTTVVYPIAEVVSRLTD